MRKISIEGMHCSACEDKVISALNKQKGIEVTKINAARGYVVFKDSENISSKKIDKIISNLGYTVTNDEAYKDNNRELIDIVLIIFFFIAFLNLSKIYTPTFDDSSKITLSLVFSFGILNSLHCMGMCGSILMSYLIGSKDHKKTGTYNYIFGRIISYTSVGAILGLFGSAFTISETFKGYTLVIGSIIMFLMALKMIGLLKLPRIKFINIKFKPGRSMFAVGLLNGLMPCGPLQIMQLYALTSGSVISGALIMFTFSIATSISLLILGLTSNKIKFFKSKNFKYVGFIIILIIAFNMFSGGIAQYQTSSTKTSSVEFTQTIDDEIKYQEITLTINGGYEFNMDSIEVGKPVKIKFNPVRLDGCNNPAKLMSPSGEVIEVDFTKDEYVIFTPSKKGKLKVICWMNMRFGSITVK